MTDEIKKQVAQAIRKKMAEEIFQMDEIHGLFDELLMEYMDEVETVYVSIEPSQTGKHEICVSFLEADKFFFKPLEIPEPHGYGGKLSEEQREGNQGEINALRRLAADITAVADKAQERLDRSPPL